MADVVDTAVRSRMMAGIKGKDTKPEVLVRKALFKEGLRFRLHRKDLPGRPDIVLPRHKVVVFVHGCFWHSHAACRYARLPATRTEFWRSKLMSNVERDERNRTSLRGLSWRVLTVWECATRAEAQGRLPGLLAEWVAGTQVIGEIDGLDKYA